MVRCGVHYLMDYGVAVDGKTPFILPETKQFKLGKYKLSVWVKRAGTEGVKSNASGLGNYDNYYLKELNCVYKKEVIIQVTSISLNKTTDTLIIGGTDTLLATVNPMDASNKAVVWTSSNPTIVAVDNTGKVTAVSVGTAAITATTVDGGKTATCTVNSISEKIVEFFPKLPDVPQPAGLIYKDNYVNGDFVFYLYDLNFDFAAYRTLLSSNGWEYYTTNYDEANNPIEFYIKGDNIVGVGTFGQDISIFGNIH